jgi:hypothetical protein
MQHLQVSGAVRPLRWPLGVKLLIAYNRYRGGIDFISSFSVRNYD